MKVWRYLQNLTMALSVYLCVLNTLRCSQNGTHFYVRNNTCHKDFWRDFTNHSLYFELFEVWYIAGYYSISSIKCLWLRKYYWMRHKLRKSKHYASREVCADNDMESQPELTPLKSSHIFHGLTTNDLSCWRGRHQSSGVDSSVSLGSYCRRGA